MGHSDQRQCVRRTDRNAATFAVPPYSRIPSYCPPEYRKCLVTVSAPLERRAVSGFVAVTAVAVVAAAIVVVEVARRGAATVDDDDDDNGDGRRLHTITPVRRRRPRNLPPFSITLLYDDVRVTHTPCAAATTVCIVRACVCVCTANINLAASRRQQYTTHTNTYTHMCTLPLRMRTPCASVCVRVVWVVHTP